MAKISLALILLVLFCIVVTGSYATDPLEEIGAIAGTDGAKYEVTFTVRYNSVSPEKAARMVQQFLLRHSSACKVETKIKKVGRNSNVLTINASD